MSDKPKNTARPDEKAGSSRRGIVLWLVIVLSIAAGTAVCITLGVLALIPVLFTENPRMAMRRVELISRTPMASQGYWSTNKEELARRLELNGSTSLWKNDSGELRRKLEDPRQFSSILRAHVYKEIPDTLRIEIIERTPIAFIGGTAKKGRDELVVDENCMLIKRRESIVAGVQWNGALPVISGITPQDTPGVVEPQLAPAVALITEVQNKNGVGLKLTIIEVELKYPNKMICRFRCGGFGEEFRAVFPILNHEKQLPVQVLALKTTLLRFPEEGADRREFDLTFDGQVVVRGRKKANNPKHKNGKK